MRTSIINTATIEQKGCIVFSFFVYYLFCTSLCNLNMVVDIFTLSLNVYIYNEEKTGRIVLPNEIVMRQYTGGIYVKGHT